ncbi:hypothetical protein [Streptomyces sp. NPDC048419]|uniref:HNH endonuclease n=1 Tax=Streptomyces sp. NPDC048419 TaxID=3365547 RepID=UPI003716FA68
MPEQTPGSGRTRTPLPWTQPRAHRLPQNNVGGRPLRRDPSHPQANRCPDRPIIASPGNGLIHRLLAGKCEISSAGRGLQVHHLRKLADLNRPGRPDRPSWMTLMAARRHTTLVVCSACHHSIHAGRGSALPRK